MMNKAQLVTLLLFIFNSSLANAQKERLIGLWEVLEVREDIGSRTITPVAKWARINSDGTFQSGNGWLQNSSGNWAFEEQSKTLTVIDPLAVKDEFGGFKVTFENELMFWEREEEGMMVKVTLQPIESIPMAISDYLQGAWHLTEITKNGTPIKDEFDSNNTHRMLIRWDRIYVSIDPEGTRSTGYWHIHGHRPEITFLSHVEGKQPERWRVEVTESQLVMTGISEEIKMIQCVYQRKNTF